MANLLATVTAPNGLLSDSRKLAAAAGVVTALAVLIATAFWINQPTWVPIFRGLELAEVGEISQQLTQEGIAFRLGGGGQDVEVAVADAPRARVLLAQAGLPAGGKPGLELFDRPAWGMTDFTQRITYRRALEGELSRTIRLVKGVEGAQVHLALPESSPLRRLERPAQAAVVLTLRAGVTLTPETVKGISHILSNSVEQLSPEDVAVMDNSGRLLSTPMGDESSPVGLTTRQLEVQREVEDHLRSKVEALLTATIGQTATKVEVTASLSFEQSDRTTESFDPEGQVLQSEQRSEPGTGGEGAPTVISNNYQNTRRLERIVGAVGTIERLSVAVLIDENVITATDPDGRQRQSLEVAIRNAVGFDPLRGDQVSVLSIPFGSPVSIDPTSSLPPSAESPGIIEIAERFSRPAVALIAVILAFMMGLRALKSRPAAAPARSSATTMSALPQPAPVELPTESQLLRSSVQRQSTSTPETAAKVIRTWLAETS